MPATPEDLFARLDRLGIKHASVSHPPLFTVAESRALRATAEGAHSKNLFVKDKKSRLFLLVAEESARIDLKRVHERIGAQGRVSFGAAEALEAIWGVKPGSVTPFGAINDAAGLVSVVLEAGLMAQDRLNFHPLVNTMTTTINSRDLVAFLKDVGHDPAIAAFAEPDEPPAR